MAIVSQQNWLIQKFIMEDILKKLPKLSLDTPFYGTHNAAFLCYFLGKNSALRIFIHLLEKSLMINNMLIRVYKKCRIFFNITFYILDVSVSWISTLNYIIW